MHTKEKENLSKKIVTNDKKLEVLEK